MSERRRQSGAAAIVEVFKREGVRHVFCVPGESYLPVLDELIDSEIEVVSGRQEGGVAFIAEAYGKCTNRASVVMATRGVGGANATIGVHTAFQDSTPMILLLGQVDSKFLGREGFQEVDMEAFFGPISKWVVEITDAERVPELLQRAFRIAQSGRPGPVVVSLPENMLKVEREMSYGPSHLKATPAPSKEESRRIEEILSKAERPLILAGGGIKRSEAENELLRFVDLARIPVMSAFRRHDVFPNDHPFYVGHLGLGTPKELLDIVEEADTILAIGTRLSEVTTQDYTLIHPHHSLVHVDICDDSIGKVYAPTVGIQADAKEALRCFCTLGALPNWHNWAYRSRLAYERTTKLKDPPGFKNEHVIQALIDVLPKDAVITNDAGNFAGWLHRYYPFTKKNTYVGPTSGAMGYGMPAAIGAKYAYPERTVVSLSGDGGFMMTCQEIETAVRYNIPIIALVFNNAMYGTIRMHQEIHFPTRVTATDLSYVRFDALARSLGANGIYVHSVDELKYALSKAMYQNQPTVIEIPMNKEQITVTRTLTELKEAAVQRLRNEKGEPGE
ncbi:acetolactate synthase [Pontibacillus halophilus JSM 076056 = DSM 19796]|uniref:Acetolactate synthase n=1 Tax=Pontibacillus halophilus JSM 076056 = DSM 19796 TaxID=1385510 RepID=A0A0A5GGK8_9BACI|nr:thiamine pyrophosphate-dependent enzyme [Pontibacillus halophilus]KGX91119.1 acetolactate synthase [Pontibacillus halophilus JSM 076056 = DSM 19796]